MANLNWLTVDELKAMCRKEGLPDTGNKNELVGRLRGKTTYTLRKQPRGRAFPGGREFTVAKKGGHFPGPTRDDVRVEAWQERDRLGIWVTDNRTGKTIIEWWDDDARQLFEDGFFKPGVPQHSWEKPTPQFINSVLDYAEHIGVLSK